jgi:hypothetical protein
LADLLYEIPGAGYTGDRVRVTAGQSGAKEGSAASETIVFRIEETERAIAIKHIKKAGL